MSIIINHQTRQETYDNIIFASRGQCLADARTDDSRLRYLLVLHGKIKEVNDTTFVIEIADGVRIQIEKASVFALTEDNKK